MKPAGLSKPVDLADNEQIRLGTDNDLKIYFDGNHSRITNSTGALSIQADDININNAANNEQLATFTTNGAVELFYAHSKKLETVTGGVTVTGVATATRLDLAATTGSVRWNELANSQSRSWDIIGEQGAYGVLDVKYANAYNGTPDEISARFKANGAVELYYDNNKKFESTSVGIDVQGQIHALGGIPQLRLNTDTSDGSSTRAMLGMASANNNFVNGAVVNDVVLNCPKDFIISHGSTELMAVFKDDSAVELYYDSSKKFETTSSGTTTTGDSYVTGKVLIGTTTEGNGGADDLTVANSGTGGITIRSGTSNDGNLWFSDGTSGTDEYRGYVQYEHANDRFNFGTAAATKLSIDNAGRVLIGGTSSVAAWSQNNRLQVQGTEWNTAGATIAKLNNNSHSPNLIFAASRGSSPGTAAQSGDHLGVITFNGDDGTDIATVGAMIRARIDGTVSSNRVDGQLDFLTHNAGSTVEKVRIHPTGEVTIPYGVTLGTAIDGHGASNTLDDYEEGDWTPIANNGFANVTYQSSERTGHYTKIGRLVFLDFYIRFESGGSTTSTGAHIHISGLPYSIMNTSRSRGGGTTSYENINSSNDNGAGNISFYGSQGNTNFGTYVGSSGWTATNGTSQAGSYIIGTFTYHTD